MHTLLDTNILLRSSQPSSRDHFAAVGAVAALAAFGRTLSISSQTIYEFFAVATRPIAENGLGMSHHDADVHLGKLLASLNIFYDSEAIAIETRKLIVAHQVTGKKTHDAAGRGNAGSWHRGNFDLQWRRLRGDSLEFRFCHLLTSWQMESKHCPGPRNRKFKARVAYLGDGGDLVEFMHHGQVYFLSGFFEIAGGRCAWWLVAGRWGCGRCGGWWNVGRGWWW